MQLVTTPQVCGRSNHRTMQRGAPLVGAGIYNINVSRAALKAAAFATPVGVVDSGSECGDTEDATVRYVCVFYPAQQRTERGFLCARQAELVLFVARSWRLRQIHGRRTGRCC